MRLNVLLLATTLVLATCATQAANVERPNIVIVLCDNLGYGDVGCYGSTLHLTPHVDRLAREGLRLTACYSASGVCTPSRAALMTGCYPLRVDMHMSDTGGAVLQPVARKGLHPDETTIADVLKTRGYATALIGKWHLGDQPQFLPTRQGFDHYLGIPYSDDMTARAGQPWPELPLMRGEQVIEAPVDRDLLTQRYTDETIRFIEQHRAEPFFIVLSHAMPGSTHHPFSSPKFRGQSANGDWGDSVEEIDHSTGQLLAALERLKLDDRTLLIWTSDNGAMRRDPPQGSNRPLRGWGYSTDEGGMRMPCLVRWPGTVPAGVTCGEVCSLLDFLPTAARLAGATLDPARTIDGRDITPLLKQEPGAQSPHAAFYFYHMNQLQAVRSGKWKLYLPLAEKRVIGKQKRSAELALYDLELDVAEEHNRAADEPEVVARLMRHAETARLELGDGERPGRGQRRAGFEPEPTPRVRQ